MPTADIIPPAATKTSRPASSAVQSEYVRLLCTREMTTCLPLRLCKPKSPTCLHSCQTACVESSRHPRDVRSLCILVTNQPSQLPHILPQQLTMVCPGENAGSNSARLWPHVDATVGCSDSVRTLDNDGIEGCQGQRQGSRHALWEGLALLPPAIGHETSQCHSNDCAA